MLIESLENKIINLLTTATITDVDTFVVQGIHDTLIDWDEYEEYPRIVVTCDGINPQTEQIGGACTREYIVNIFVLCYNEDKTACLLERNTILERIEETLRYNQRLDNLADNNNNESVYGSKIETVKLSKFGMNEDYTAVAWIQFMVFTDRKIPR